MFKLSPKDARELAEAMLDAADLMEGRSCCDPRNKATIIQVGDRYVAVASDQDEEGVLVVCK